MLRRQYYTRVYVVFLHANAIILTDTSVYIDINVRYPALSVWKSHADICLSDGYMFFLWWKLSPQVFFDVPRIFMTKKLNFPLCSGGPKVTFSYALPFPTHLQCYTLLACVPQEFAFVIHVLSCAGNSIPSYILRLRLFFLRLRPIAITR
jgi:hypothetical protein